MDRLKILTINLWGVFGPNPDRRLALARRQIEALNPDVVCIQESEGLQPLTNPLPLLPYKHECRQSNLMILTRRPIVHSGVRRCANQPRDESRIIKFLWAKIDFGGKILTITNTHLCWKPENAPLRRAQASQLAGFLNKNVPAIACGDFNSTFSSRDLLDLRTSGCVDVLNNFPDGSRPTWDNANPYIQSHRARFPNRRIDLVLLQNGSDRSDSSGEIVVENAYRCLDTPEDGIWASDHYGVLAIIRTGLGEGRCLQVD